VTGGDSWFEFYNGIRQRGEHWGEVWKPWGRKEGLLCVGYIGNRYKIRHYCIGRRLQEHGKYGILDDPRQAQR
jgi:hypothetical protein